jgi:hypothetical protein
LSIHLDIQQAPWYINWKTGVELKLYAFQLVQLQSEMTVLLAPTVVPKKPFNKPMVHDWAVSDIFSTISDWDTEISDFPSWNEPPTPPQWVMPAKVTLWLQTEILWPPKEHTQDIVVAKANTFMQITSPLIENTQDIAVGKAMAFMQTHQPGGPLHDMKPNMNKVEHRVGVYSNAEERCCISGGD